MRRLCHLHAKIKSAAARVPGAEVVIMDGLGPFPMSEDPERFGAYIRPVLDEIIERRAA